MIIVLQIVLMIAFSFFAGYGVIGFYSFWSKPKIKEHSVLIIPVVGYVISQVLFLEWYKVFENSTLSIYLTVLSITLINIPYVIVEHKRTGTVIKTLVQHFQKLDKKFFLVLLFIFVLSSWQYILIGQGHYYHSGNEDFFDGIDGGEAFLRNTPIKFIFFDSQLTHVNYHAVITYQYSSQAFWRLFLNVGGMDAFMLQSILNLLLMSIGVYWLTLVVFKGAPKAALFASFSSVALSFYFVTYMTGHIGSMMYDSVLPILIGFFLLWMNKEAGWSWVVVIFILYKFIDGTYPGPINFVIIPAVLFLINKYIFIRYGVWSKISTFLGYTNGDSNTKKLKNLKIFRFSLAILFIIISTYIFSIWVWEQFSWLRTDALLRYNESWKITLFKEMFMVFWGVYPPGSTGTISVLPLFISNDIINSIALIIAIAISVLIFFAVLKSCRQENRQFLLIYVLCFIPSFIVMRYFWGSSYYLYKFLYTHLFLFAIIYFVWLFEHLFVFKVWKTKIIMWSFIVLGVLNITWDISLGIDFYTRPYHNQKDITDFFNKVPKNILSKSYLDIPNEVNRLAFTKIFRSRGVNPQLDINFTKLNYIVKIKNIKDPIHNSTANDGIIYRNGLLSIEKFNKENFMRMTTPYSYEPYNLNGVSVNWMGNGYSMVKYKFHNEAQGLINYLKSTDIYKGAFLDIENPNLKRLVYESTVANNLRLENDPEKARWFIRVISTGHFTLENRNERSVYEKMKNESTEWRNDIFEIVELPFNNRKFRISETQIIGKLRNVDIYDYSYLFPYIKSHGNKVYIDIPRNEYLYSYLKTALEAHQINVVSRKEYTNLFFRIVLSYPYNKHVFYTEKSLNEKVIGSPFQPDNFSSRGYNIVLVDIPFEDRISLSPDYYRFIENKRIAEGRNYDFSLVINNISSKAKYLRVLIEPGPSLDFKDFVLKISSDYGIVKRFDISINNSLVDLHLIDFEKSIKDSALNLNFEAENVVGHSLMPLDDRFLNYAIFGIELTESISEYSPFLLRALNHQPIKVRTIFEKIMGSKEISDIIDTGDTSICKLGRSWYQSEEYMDENFRWVGNKPAEIVLSKLDEKQNTVAIDIEPGPGCGGKTLDLTIFYKDQLISEEQISGRKKIEINLPPEIYVDNKEQVVLSLISKTENIKIASDPRILNYRVFNISLKEKQSQQKSIINNESLDKISLGNGWYPFETFDNKDFRWVGEKPAEITINDKELMKKELTLKLEPGPGCEDKPLHLEVFFNDKLFTKGDFISLDTLTLDFSKIPLKDIKDKNIIKLVPVTKNKRIPTDERILNFRVFNINLNTKENIVY